jgi:hypothetical protein
MTSWFTDAASAVGAQLGVDGGIQTEKTAPVSRGSVISRMSSSDDMEKMAEFGITCVPVDQFYFREYHYTDLNDAIAEAKRHPIAKNRR